VVSRALWAGLLCALGLSSMQLAAAEDWIAASPEELQMTSVPEAPGAPALFLYRQVDRDDSKYNESIYVRIKILTEAGLNYANVEIPFVQGAERISSIQARTIRPDGSVVNFDGTIYEKPIVKSDRVKYLAKTFTLPEAEVGSILEYRYEHTLPYGWVYDSHWVLSQDLFTRFARFSLIPNPSFTVIWSWPHGLPPGTDSPKMERGRIRLEAHDIPGVVTEEHMPPEDEVRFRVDFIYDPQRSARNDPVEFWKVHGKSLYKKVQEFCDKRSAMEKAVAQVTAPGDSPETKLRKLYARVQKIHNLSYSTVGEREARRERPDSIHNVEDVWIREYGTAEQITWLYLALARAAGADARPVIISTRDRYFFDHRLMNQTELNAEIVLVKLDGKDLYVEPAVPFNPFGMLPWYETTVEGLCLDKAGGVWLRTPESVAADSRIERRATFKFDSGTLEGQVTVTYTGLEAAWRRLDERSEDEVARQKFLEQDLEGYIPTGVQVKLTNSPDWDGGDTPLIASYYVEIPGWAAPAGRRAMLPVGIFGNAEKHTFEHATRVHPLSFEYCYQHIDDVTIDVPPPWTFESIPGPTLVDFKGMVFKENIEKQQHSLHVTRELILNVSLVGAQAYSTVRQFYQTVRTADEAQAVLSPGATGRN
jgi:uncharacterized protein DUF3857/transglutaminase superfamily protein